MAALISMLERSRRSRVGSNQPGSRQAPTATSSECASRWDATVLSQHKPSTQSSVRSQLRKWLLPALGTCALKDLDGIKVQQFVANCKKNPKTVRNLVATLRMMWNSAGGVGLRCAQPLRRAGPPKAWTSSYFHTLARRNQTCNSFSQRALPDVLYDSCRDRNSRWRDLWSTHR